MEAGKSLLTFKEPVQPSSMKLREELETVVGDGTLLPHLRRLGFHVWFRYEKLPPGVREGRRHRGHR
jgi:adenylate cyclase class IV